MACKLRILAVKHSGHAPNMQVGEVREVLPVDHQPSKHEQHLFYYVESDLTIEEAVAKYMRSGVPQELLDAEEAESLRVLEESKKGNKVTFDEKKRVNREAYPSRMTILDLTKFDQQELIKIQNSHNALINNREAIRNKTAQERNQLDHAVLDQLPTPQKAVIDKITLATKEKA